MTINPGAAEFPHRQIATAAKTLASIRADTGTHLRGLLPKPGDARERLKHYLLDRLTSGDATAAVKDPARPFTLIVRFRIKEGAAAKFEAAFAKATQATRQEKGNRAYDLNRDPQTPTQYLLYERWQDLSALEAHLKTPYITKLLAEMGDLQAAPPESSVLLPVAP